MCAGEEISSVPSEEILPELTALRITRTRIESLPRGAFSNRSIEVLSLDRNSIASIERWDVICHTESRSQSLQLGLQRSEEDSLSELVLQYVGLQQLRQSKLLPTLPTFGASRGA